MARGKKTGGRQKGTPNKMGRSARQAFQDAFDVLQQQGPTLPDWATKNAGQFYTLYARLIPVEHTGDQGGPIATVVKHIYETQAKRDDPRS